MKINSTVKKIICIMLALLMLVCAASCGKDKTKKKKKVVIKKIIVTSDEESTTEDTKDDFVFPEDEEEDFEIPEEEFEINKIRRELASKDKEGGDTYVPEFTQKTVDWKGPRGYVIVYKNGDKYSKLQAKYLQAFFKKIDGVELKIVTDSTPAVTKEILVGNTNRYTTTLGENHFAVNLKGNKLVFEGGHRAMVEKAVKWFMSIDRIDGKVTTLKGKAKDFTSTLSGGYKYVWGEEFDGNFLDNTKFVFGDHMGVGGTNTTIQIDDDDLIRVENGLFKMSTAHYYYEYDENVEVGMAPVVCTGDTMQWLYGYAEIRALVPCQKGAWPAWWATSHCPHYPDYYDPKNFKYMVEVDFFEVFGSDSISPNIHKWYDQPTILGTMTYIEENGIHYRHSGYGDMGLEFSKYKMSQTEALKYHTYGFKWTPDEMVMSVDGNEYMTYDLNKNFDKYTDMSHFKNDALHMIFDNYAYYEGGTYTNEYNMLKIKDLPFNFFVDYVRIYQRDGEGFIKDFGVDKAVNY